MKTILLVEDDKEITIALGFRLRSMGFNVVSASDAITAMNETVRCQPDAIMLDINLPGGNGFIVAEIIQASNQVASTPLIFMIASRKPEFRQQASECGAVSFLEKPFGVTQLTAAIDSCFD